MFMSAIAQKIYKCLQLMKQQFSNINESKPIWYLFVFTTIYRTKRYRPEGDHRNSHLIDFLEEIYETLEDARGRTLVDSLLANRLIALNNIPCLPTYESDNRKGWPDLAICTQSLFAKFQSWSILLELFGDHRPIETSLFFEIPNLP